MLLSKDNHWTNLLNSPSRMWNAWLRILQQKPAVSIQSQHGSSRNSVRTLLHSSPASSTCRYCRASSRRISASQRWRQSSKSLPSNPFVLGSYRPISNLSFISKVLEWAVNEKMLLYFHSNGLLPEHQSAYRRSHSKETALLKLTSDRSWYG